MCDLPVTGWCEVDMLNCIKQVPQAGNSDGPTALHKNMIAANGIKDYKHLTTPHSSQKHTDRLPDTSHKILGFD